MYFNVFFFFFIDLFFGNAKCIFFFLEMHAVSDGIISEDQIRSQKFSVTLQTLYDKAKKNSDKAL